MKIEPDDTQPSEGPGGRELVNFLDDQGLLDDPDTTKGVMAAMKTLMDNVPDSLSPVKVSKRLAAR